MKKITNLILFIAMTATSVFAQTLSERQLNLATIASLEAQGDLNRLKPAIIKALDSGITVNEIKDAFSQLYAYTGFPRSLNALGVLATVVNEGSTEGKTWPEGKAFTTPEIWKDADKSLKQGTDVQTQLCGGKPFNYDFCPQNDYYLKAHLFGDIFASDQLTPAEREIVTVAALSGMKGVEPQFAAHKAGAVALGNTKEQVDELCKYLSQNGLSNIDNSSDAKSGDWNIGSPNDAYAKYFIGNSHLNPIQPKNLQDGEKTVQGYSNVTFEPGCRNNWHIHHGAHQILICVSGKGWYQEWGKPAIALKAGDIIDIPEGVKHWHGAQKDSWFQHLASHVKVGENESNEWLEPVTDDVYNNLK